jgi:anti-anti-sigma regulatory factor
MEFKIDTKPSYSIITPVYDSLNANLTDAIRQKWEELAESGSENLAVDLQNCTNAEESAYDALVKMHEEYYGNGQSLVFTNLQPQVMQALKQDGLTDVINIAPTMAEAADIISMEVLERDLFKEES